jgi:hypothetical protein
MSGHAGFDFVIIDNEHGPASQRDGAGRDERQATVSVFQFLTGRGRSPSCDG